MNLCCVQILDEDDDEAVHSIVVKTRTRVVRLSFESRDAKLEWVKLLWEAVSDTTRQRLQENDIDVADSPTEAPPVSGS